MNLEEYEKEHLLSQAIYIINQVVLGFNAEEKLLLKTFKRVRPNPPTHMVRTFLPQYLHDDSLKFIKEYERFKERKQTTEKEKIKEASKNLSPKKQGKRTKKREIESDVTGTGSEQ